MPYQKSIIPSFKKVANNLVRLATNTAELEILGFATVHAKRFQTRIKVQGFESFKRIPLSPNYAAFKERKGLDPRTMIATGYYVDKISVHVQRIRGKKVYYIGFDPKDKAHTPDGKEADITLVEVAWVQEYGSDKAHIPARPHWRPFYTNILLPNSRELGKKIASLVVRDLKRINNT